MRHVAARAGAHIGTLCGAIHRRDGERGVRRILGVLGLAKKHSPAVVDEAYTSPTQASAEQLRCPLDAW
jgi:hypothetical protein